MLQRVIDAYRWRRILSSSKLDPHALPRPVDPPGEHDFIVAGCPRTGTSLLAASLHQPPDIAMVMEPWDGLRMPPAELFASLRREIVESGELTRGRLNLDAIAGGTVEWHREGEQTYEVETSTDFMLGVKWPTFWQYLDLLPTTRFLITLRHPVEVIASFGRVGGRLEQGLEYDVAFNDALNADLTRATADVQVRRALLYQYINSRLLPHLGRDNVLAVRYEDWFEDPERLWERISEFLGVPLTSPEVAIRARNGREPSSEIVDLVRRHVPVAVDLGYDV